jgi:hypothetical protein
LDSGLQIEKKTRVNPKKDFRKAATRSSKILKERNGVIRGNGSNANRLGKNGKERVKWYGHVLWVGGNGWVKVILTGGRKEEKEQEERK